MGPIISSPLRKRRAWLRAGVALTGLALLAAICRLYLPAPTEAQPIPPGAGIVIAPSLFQDGDVLFRRGRSFISRAVLSVDESGYYSHVGLVSLRQSQVWILHAVPTEEHGGAAGVIAEPLRVFLAPGQAVAAALYRPLQPSSASPAAQAAWNWVRSGTPFDGAFDLSTHDRLYCTELIWKAYLAAGVDLCDEVPGAPCSDSPRTQYLLPSHLQESPHLRLIQETRKD